MTAPTQIEALGERMRADADEIEACGGGNEAATMREAADMLTALSAQPAAPDEGRAREVLDRVADALPHALAHVNVDTAIRAMLAFARECAAPTISGGEGGA